MKQLYNFAKQELQAAAVPAFLRLQRQYGEMTGTMKFIKKEYVATGFDPSKTEDPLFFRDDEAATYVPIDTGLFNEVCAGQKKF